MSMIPIKKMDNPSGSGKCYPLSVFESIVTTGPLVIANDIGGYKKGDTIPAETRFSVIFHNMFEVEGSKNNIVTTFDEVSDDTVPSSRLTYNSLITISQSLMDKENVGVAKALIDELKQGIISTHTNQISDIYENKADKSYVTSEFDDIKSAVLSNTNNIELLNTEKQDKLFWESVQYDPATNRAITIADLRSLATTLRNEFVRITQFKGVIQKQEGESILEAIERFYQEKGWIKQNGDVVIIDRIEYVYCTSDNEWHDLGNTDGFIKSGSRSIRDNDFDSLYKISQDYIIGLNDIQSNVSDLTDETIGVPNIKKQVASHEERIFNIETKYPTKDEVSSDINNAKVDSIISSKNYTDEQIGALRFSNTDTANLTTNSGVVSAVKSILMKLGMPESNIQI